MVTRYDDRRGYLGDSTGAPPPPPPGGYAGARRLPVAAQPAAAVAEPRPRPGALGWAALAASALLALVLLVMGLAHAPAAIYSVGAVGVQAVVLVLVVAALVPRRSRMLGSIALAITLFVNMGTVGAATAIATGVPASPVTTPEQDHWAAYPGIKGQSEDEILAQPSLESSTASAEEVFAAVRERLTELYGVSWVEVGDGTTRAERNGYGGESMLVQYTSSTWATEQPVSGYARKSEVMEAIAEVYDSFGLYWPVAFNDPAQGLDDAYLERFYGTTDPRTQTEWEWYTEDLDGDVSYYANITDLANDVDGGFRTSREAQVAGSEEPLEGLRLSFVVRESLSEADVDEFSRRMADY